MDRKIAVRFQGAARVLRSDGASRWTKCVGISTFALILGACDSLNPFAEEDGAIVVTPDARSDVLVSDSTGHGASEPNRASVPAADSTRVRLYMPRIWQGRCRN